MLKPRYKIVLVVPAVPAPKGNADSMAYFCLVHALRRRGHTVHLLVACRDHHDAAATKKHFADAETFIKTSQYQWLGKWKTLRRPYSYLFSDALHKAVDQHVKAGADILHVEQLWTGWVGWDYPQQTYLNVHYLPQIDQPFPDDALRRYLTNLTARRLLRRFSHVGTLSTELASGIEQMTGRRPEVAPLPMDVSYFPFGMPVKRSNFCLGLIGNYRWRPSIQAANYLFEHWPAIHALRPSARLRVVGRAANQFSHKARTMPGVDIFSDVEDVIPHYRAMDALVYLPHAGSGIKVKVLEAMALGVPIVTNAHGVEGLEVVSGEHAMVLSERPTRECLIEAVEHLAPNFALRVRLAKNARQLIEDVCDPDRVVTMIEQRYETLTAKCASL